jgi:NTP pyrophosphatase (non-canonical NTP hydrolase)
VVDQRRRHPGQPVGIAAPDPPGPLLLIEEFQQLMARTYGARDRARGRDATVAWLAEELGELARAARKGTREEQLHELGDVLAWLASLADQLDLSLDEAAARYAQGCPRCGGIPCACP